MAEQLKATFLRKREQNQAAFVAFLTAGFPTKDDTLDLLFALERGGADIIEVGVPFSDPQADGPVIQESNNMALAQGIDSALCRRRVIAALAWGRRERLILMGYYNPLHAYGEERAVRDARAAGANGFIVVDLLTEEAGQFLQSSRQEIMSVVPNEDHTQRL